MKKIIVLLMMSPLWLVAQNLTFSKPAIVNQNAKSDKAFSVVKFRESYYIAWKEPGANANINVGYAGKHLTPNSIINQKSIPNCQSAFAPALCASSNNLYLFWIDNNSNLKYHLTSDTTFTKFSAKKRMTKENAAS